jgi:flavodoxin
MFNSLVVYFSNFGNTRQVAEAIAEALSSAGEVRMVSMGELSEASFKEADLVVMGSPTHNMNLPKAVKPVLEHLPKKILKGKFFAAFDTSYEMSPFMSRFTASKKLSRKLRKQGGKQILAPEMFLVEGREGPLFPGEIERAKVWANAILRLAV